MEKSGYHLSLIRNTRPFEYNKAIQIYSLPLFLGEWSNWNVKKSRCQNGGRRPKAFPSLALIHVQTCEWNPESFHYSRLQGSERYASKAAQFYKRRLDAEVAGQIFDEAPPEESEANLGNRGDIRWLMLLCMRWNKFKPHLLDSYEVP